MIVLIETKEGITQPYLIHQKNMDQLKKKYGDKLKTTTMKLRRDFYSKELIMR